MTNFHVSSINRVVQVHRLFPALWLAKSRWKCYRGTRRATRTAVRTPGTLSCFGNNRQKRQKLDRKTGDYPPKRNGNHITTKPTRRPIEYPHFQKADQSHLLSATNIISSVSATAGHGSLGPPLHSRLHAGISEREFREPCVFFSCFHWSARVCRHHGCRHGSNAPSCFSPEGPSPVSDIQGSVGGVCGIVCVAEPAGGGAGAKEVDHVDFKSVSGTWCGMGTIFTPCAGDGGIGEHR